MNRVLDLIRAKTEDLQRRFRNPEKLLALFIEDYERRLADARSACAFLVKDCRRMQTAIDEHGAGAAGDAQAAQEAINEGRRTEARLALLRKIEHDHAARRLGDELAQLRAANERAAGDLAELADILCEARRKHDRLGARKNLARALPEAVRKKPDENLDNSLDINGPRAAAVDDEIEHTFRQIEKEEKLQAEMEALKAATRKKNDDTRET